MLYIGTSLGGCLLSIMNGEVSEDEVMVIITRTDAPTFERFLDVVRAYHAQGNPYASSPERYEYEHDLAEYLALATRLWNSGKIHQPRVFNELRHYRHPFENGNKLWFQIVPTNDNDTPAVVEAYEKYKMLDTLTK